MPNSLLTATGKLNGHHKRLIRSMLLSLVVILPTPLHGEEAALQPVNWAYSAFFGTGWYGVEGNRSVFALHLPFRHTRRSSSLTDDGQRNIGFEIHYPLTVGLHSTDDLPGFVDPDNFGTLIFTPGLELEIPLTQRWYLRPFVNIGWGTELDNDNSSWIYYAGLKSRYTFAGGDDNWSLVNNLYYAGYSPRIGQTEDLAAILTAVEFRQPLKLTTASGKPVDLHWSLGYSYLFDDLDFTLPGSYSDSPDDQYIAGLAYSLRNHPLKLWFMTFDRLGLEYRFSSDGSFKSVTLNMNSLFKR